MKIEMDISSKSKVEIATAIKRDPKEVLHIVLEGDADWAEIIRAAIYDLKQEYDIAIK